MNETKKKVASARRRLILHDFLWTFSWAIFAALIVIATGIAVPKIWHLKILDSDNAAQFWTAGWIIGGSLISIVITAGLTLARRPDFKNAAQEVDRRFELKERISSALAMTKQEQSTAAGAALAQDAQRQAEDIVVSEQFKLEPRWSMALPLVPAILLGVLLLVPNAVLDQPVAGPAAATKKSEAKKIKTAVEDLQKKIRDRELTKGLKDAELNLDKIEQQFDDLNGDEKLSKKNALIKLNNIKKQIEEKQKQLGSSRALKEALNQLKALQKSPAKQLSDAVKAGNMKAAKNAINQLAKKLKSGKLSEAEKAKLKKDMNAIADQLKEIANKHEERKQEIKKQIAKAKANGDLDKAANLQQKLEDLEKQDQQKKKMNDLAKAMQNCAKCIKPGEGGEKSQPAGGQKSSTPKDAETETDDISKPLEDLAKQIQDLQEDMDQLQDLEDFQDAIQEAKEAMNDDQDGAGEGEADKEGGRGMGDGKGIGDRPRADGDTGFYKSRVKSKLQRGKTFAAGKADGQNLTGQTTSEAREIVTTNMSSQKDPLENQVLPKSKRKHAQQYFESLRKSR